MDWDARPILVFWETTRACGLACAHCRAEAMPHSLPGELITAEGIRFIESLKDFGAPAPVLILTGGDVLRRPDAFSLLEHAARLGIPVGMAPSVTPLLDAAAIDGMRAYGVKSVSVSLDGDGARTHDRIRGVPGHFTETVRALDRLVAAGFAVQVNTVVMEETVEALPGIARLLRDHGVSIWEVFFLVGVGRGRGMTALSAARAEDVAHWLVDAGTRGITIRTVEAPFVRRVAAERRRRAAGVPSPQAGPLYRALSARLEALCGSPTTTSRVSTSLTRDGKGIVFVAYDGSVYPSGFLPLRLGNVRDTPLVEIYRANPLLKAIRRAAFKGPCGTCGYRQACGGSRARAWQQFGDPLASDPACVWVAGA